MRLRWLLPVIAGVFAVPFATGTVRARDSWQPAVEAAPAEAPSIESLKASLGPDDPLAALEAMQRALDEVGDGQAYIWHRETGPLWGVVRPLSTYRAATGSPCRRISMVLSIGEFTRSTRVSACRQPSGRWEVQS
jgi:hypothetical protein